MNSDLTFMQISRWIDAYASDYATCFQPAQAAYVPTRLLDIGKFDSSHVKLIETIESDVRAGRAVWKEGGGRSCMLAIAFSEALLLLQKTTPKVQSSALTGQGEFTSRFSKDPADVSFEMSSHTCTQQNSRQSLVTMCRELGVMLPLLPHIHIPPLSSQMHI